MAKRRHKKRTHVKVDDRNGKTTTQQRLPKSMVIRMGAGEVGPSVSQLVKDVRQMMEPDTASRLRERKSNKLKDYLAMSGPLGVTHLLLFSRSTSGNTNMRIALTPRGPTLNFRVEKYSLCKDIAKAQKRPRGTGKEYLNAPLLVMNNFTTPAAADDNSDPIRKQLESLTTTIFQSMFPPISPQNTPLSTIRRVMLVNREVTKEGAWLLNVRHFAITTKRTGPSKRIRRLDPTEQRHREKKGKPLPNLGKLDDAADYLLDPSAAGYTSASETELDTDNEVEVLETATRRVLSKKEQQRKRENANKDATVKTKSTSSGVEKRAVKLVELGPRLRLRMYKVEEGVCDGRVMWHDFVSKSKKEQKELDAVWQTRRKEKEERKRIQKENVERKKKEKEEARKNGKAGGAEGDEDEDEDEDDEDMDDYDAWDSEDFDQNAEADAGEDDESEEEEEEEEEEEDEMEE